MLKKLFLAVVLLAAVPSLASAWTITAKIGSGSGSLTWGTQVVTSGTGYFLVPATSASASVTVQANPGYGITQVVLDGVNVTQPGASVYTINGTANHMITAYFSPVTYSVTLNQATGGVLSAQIVAPTVGAITRTGLTGLAAGTTVQIVASPNAAEVVTNLSSTTTLGTTVLFSGQSLTPYTYNFVVGSNISFSALFNLQPQISATLVASTTSTITNGQVVLDGSGTTTNDPPVTYSYLVTSGDPTKVTLTPVTAGSNAAMVFSASATGSYVVTMTATSAHGAVSADNSGVISVMDPGAYASQQCISCHSGRNPQLVTDYLSSRHSISAAAVSCVSCHNPGGTLGHPYNIAPTDVCKGCHTSFPVTTPGHQSLVGTSICTTCHDPHAGPPVRFTGILAPHYNNITSGAYPASYLSSQNTCASCHSPVNDSAALDAVRQSWSGSGHADTTAPAWTAADFKTAGGCVRCHTRTGFVAYSSYKITAAWGSKTDMTKEVLGCNGCHNQDFTLRALRPYSSASAFTFAVDAVNKVSVPYKNLDYGVSNLCVGCHGGTTSGEVVKKAFTFPNFTAAGRLVNHFMVGGGVMDNSIGYEFDGTPGGRVLDFNKQNTWHSGIGLPSSQYNTGTYGPCVTCHMSSPGDGHSYNAVFKNTTGSIVSVSAAAVCASCHPSQLGGGDTMTPQLLTQLKAQFSSALDVLKAELQAKGFDPDQPGTIASWGATPTARANNMGAFYNYVLLRKNDVAAYVHNPTYAKRLIQYSIDWIDNGVFDGSDYTSISMLNVPQATKDQAVAYLGVSPTAAPNCFSCHLSYYN